MMIEVRGNFEAALKRFTRLVVESGLFKELRNRAAFESPTRRRKRKDHEALVRRLKKAKALEKNENKERRSWRRYGK